MGFGAGVWSQSLTKIKRRGPFVFVACYKKMYNVKHDQLGNNTLQGSFSKRRCGCARNFQPEFFKRKVNEKIKLPCSECSNLHFK